MAATPAYGVISADEAYTLDRLALIYDKSRAWAYDTFIRPVDHKTKQRLRDKGGELLPGVFHFRCGATYTIPGQSLIAWIIQYGGRYNDENE